jgi:hypothetical protein
LFVLVGGAAGGVLPGFMFRDWLLRGRVRRVLRLRSSCIACRYVLLGMPVREAGGRSVVVCSECGVETEVDPALGELETMASGEQRFQPAGAAAKSWLSEKARRRLWKTVKAGALVVSVGLPTGWGAYELWLGHQARVAESERPQQADFDALLEKQQRAGVSPDAADAWDAFERVRGAKQAAEAGMTPGPVGHDGSPISADFSEVFAPWNPAATGNPVQDANYAKDRKLAGEEAVRTLGVYQAAGVLALIDEMAAAPRAARRVTFHPERPAMESVPPSFSEMRQLARINAARMHWAMTGGPGGVVDEAEVTRSFEAMMAIGRMSRTQIFLIDHLVGVAVEALAMNRLMKVLQAGPSEELLTQLHGALERQALPYDVMRMYEGERLMALNSLGWVFTQRKEVRFGRFSRSSLGSGVTGVTDLRLPLGTWAQNRDAVNAMFDWVEREGAVSPYQRGGGAPPPPGYKYIDEMVSVSSGTLLSMDLGALYTLGMRTMIALERFRAAEGEYPQGLAELVPRYLPEVPVDPWSGKTLGYRRGVSEEAPGWGYVLYSVAADGQDNGGRAFHGVQQPVLKTTDLRSVGILGGPYDFVINRE